VLLAIGLAVLLPLGAVGLLLHRLADRYDVRHQTLLDPDARRATQTRSQATLTGPLNYLVIGTDRRPAQHHPDERADTILIVHVPAGLRRAYLVSVPRDLLIAIPPEPDVGYGGGTDKINAALHYGGGGATGARLLSATLTAVTGLRFDGAAIVDFAAFQQVINLIGGITVCVETEVRSIHTGWLFPAGCHEMDGETALDFARQRYGLPGGDHDRQRHQQQILKAVLTKLAVGDVLTNPLRLDHLIRAVTSAITVDTNGVSAPDAVRALRGLRPEALVGLRVPTVSSTIDEVSYEVLAPGAQELFAALRSGETDAWAARYPAWVNDL